MSLILPKNKQKITILSIFSIGNIHLFFFGRIEDTIIFCWDLLTFKGQIKSKADWRATDSPKNWTDEFVSFATVRKYLNLEILISSFKYFRSAKQKNQIRPFGFWENLQRQSAYGFIRPLAVFTVLGMYNFDSAKIIH